MPKTLRILTPAPGVLAYYDGRIPGHRFMPGPNWVDEGALELGIASYAIHDGNHALIYDTHVSLDHARSVRNHLEGLGITRFTVVLSHRHLDHVAGTEVFAGSPVIANAKTLAHMTRDRKGIEDATFHGPPAIDPLILPTGTFSGQTTLQIGGISVELIEAEIHSDDATILWLPETRLLFAGDCLEDCLTYVGDPDRLEMHLVDLDRLKALNPKRILPNHGAEEIIAHGGYGPRMIDAALAYSAHLIACRTDTAARALPPQQVLAEWIASGDVIWFPPYAQIHAQNLAQVTGQARIS